jgi:hypothetical protein
MSLIDDHQVIVIMLIESAYQRLNAGNLDRLRRRRITRSDNSVRNAEIDEGV